MKTLSEYQSINISNEIGIANSSMSLPLLIGLIITMFLLIFLSAVFSSSETALSSVRVSEIKDISKKSKGRKKKRADSVLMLLKDFNGTISAILIANNLVNIINTSIMTIVFTQLFGAAGVIYGTIVMTIMIVTFAEILPKIFAKKYSSKLSLGVSGIIKFLYYLTYPINAIFRKIIKDDDYLSANSEKILLQQIDHFNEEGGISKDKRNWLKNVIKLESAKAKDVMITIDNVHHIHKDTTKDELFKIFEEERLSRYPVMSEDHKKIEKVLNIKDYFAELVTSKNPDNVKWQDFTYSAIYFSQNEKLDDILDILQEQRKYFCIVTNTKKDDTAVGIITVEDIVEEIIGELYDENDELEDHIHQVGLDTVIANKETNAHVLFTKYLKNVRKPNKLDKNITFEEWMKKYFDISKFEDGKHYSYKNISIWVKTHKDSDEFMYEIDIHDK